MDIATLPGSFRASVFPTAFEGIDSTRISLEKTFLAQDLGKIAKRDTVNVIVDLRTYTAGLQLINVGTSSVGSSIDVRA